MSTEFWFKIIFINIQKYVHTAHSTINSIERSTFEQQLNLKTETQRIGEQIHISIIIILLFFSCMKEETFLDESKMFKMFHKRTTHK